MTKTHPPVWGNFLYHADEDVKASCILYRNGLMTRSYFFAVQAIEKYLKALLWSLSPELTPNDIKKNNHKLNKLLLEINKSKPGYSDNEAFTNIKKFEEFTFSTRYPYTARENHNSFSESDSLEIKKIILKVRNDIDIEINRYPLDMLLNEKYRGEEIASERDKNNYIRTCIQYFFKEDWRSLINSEYTQD